MSDQKQKTPAQSAVATRYLLMPNEANPYGTAFGGIIMSWIDMTASMAAQKHCQKEVVTASIDWLAFKEPIKIGDKDTVDGVPQVEAVDMDIDGDVDIIVSNKIKGTLAVFFNGH